MLPDVPRRVAAEAAPVAAVLTAAQHLFGARSDEAGAAAERIRAILAAQPIRLVVALDHAFRDRGVHEDPRGRGCSRIRVDGTPHYIRTRRT